jgi:hypothetical protein
LLPTIAKKRVFRGAIIGLALLCLFPEFGSPGEKDCQVMHPELEHKKQRMPEYISGLEKFYDQNAMAVVRLLSLKISKLADQVLKLEKDVAQCAKQESRDMGQGPNPVKSDERWHATAKSGELRKKLVQLLQKFRISNGARIGYYPILPLQKAENCARHLSISRM